MTLSSYTLHTTKKYVTIFPAFKNKTVLVYNGNKFLKLKISEFMISNKLGKYIKTRHKKKLNKTNKKKFTKMMKLADMLGLGSSS